MRIFDPLWALYGNSNSTRAKRVVLVVALVVGITSLAREIFVGTERLVVAFFLLVLPLILLLRLLLLLFITGLYSTIVAGSSAKGHSRLRKL
jgi:hypothetical protein